MYTALFHSTWRGNSSWDSYGAQEILHLALGQQTDGLRMGYLCRMDNHTSFFPISHSDDITLQMWIVGSVLCDIIIAVCMIYCVGFPTFVTPVSGDQSNLIGFSRGQLSRYDSTIKQTKRNLKKVIFLTIKTGSLTGIYILFESSRYCG